MGHMFGEDQITYLHERFLSPEGHDQDLDLLLFGTQHLLGFVWACRPEGLEAAQARLLAQFNAHVERETREDRLVVDLVTCFAYRVGEFILYQTGDLRPVGIAADVLCLYAAVSRRPKGMSDMEVIKRFDCPELHGKDSPDILAVSVSLVEIGVEGMGQEATALH